MLNAAVSLNKKWIIDIPKNIYHQERTFTGINARTDAVKHFDQKSRRKYKMHPQVMRELLDDIARLLLINHGNWYFDQSW